MPQQKDTDSTAPPPEPSAGTKGEGLERKEDLALPAVDVTLEDVPAAETRPPSLEEMRETSAKTVALVLVWSFAGTILLTIALACIVTAISRGSSETAKVFTDTFITLFEALGKFVSPVFGPLLAFVLGYYFSKEKRQDTR